MKYLNTARKKVIAGILAGLALLGSGVATAQLIYGNTFPFWNVNGPLNVTGLSTLSGGLTLTGPTTITSPVLATPVTLGTSNPVFITNPIADVFGIRNDTTPQGLRVYGSYTNDANAEYYQILQSAGASTVGNFAVGTGTLRSIRHVAATHVFMVGALDKLTLAAAEMQFATDNTYDIGRVATFRPRSVFAGTTVQAPKLVSNGTAAVIGACGTSPSVSGSDSAMQITVGTGGAATSCAVTFSSTYTTPPVCVAQNNTDRVAYSMVTTATTATITATAAFTAGSIFHLICIGR